MNHPQLPAAQLRPVVEADLALLNLFSVTYMFFRNAGYSTPTSATSSSINVQGQLPKRKDAIVDDQVFPVVATYAAVYQNVQSSTGSSDIDERSVKE
jgi:hypothetical protein